MNDKDIVIDSFPINNIIICSEFNDFITNYFIKLYLVETHPEICEYKLLRFV